MPLTDTHKMVEKFSFDNFKTITESHSPWSSVYRIQDQSYRRLNEQRKEYKRWNTAQELVSKSKERKKKPSKAK